MHFEKMWFLRNRIRISSRHVKLNIHVVYTMYFVLLLSKAIKKIEVVNSYDKSFADSNNETKIGKLVDVLRITFLK